MFIIIIIVIVFCIVMIMIIIMFMIISPTDSMRQGASCSAYMIPTLWPLAKTTGAPT